MLHVLESSCARCAPSAPGVLRGTAPPTFHSKMRKLGPEIWGGKRLCNCDHLISSRIHADKDGGVTVDFRPTADVT